jgi:hypothetical protein
MNIDKPNKLVKVEPTNSNYKAMETSWTYKYQEKYNSAEYPINVADHSLKLVYWFAENPFGSLVIHSVAYYCVNCEDKHCVEFDIENKNKKLKQVKKYILGYFFCSEC